MSASVVSVQSEDFDVGAEIAKITLGCKTIGAVASFVGLVRDGEDHGLSAMTLEHYPGMTEAALEDIVAQARSRWQLQAVRVIHRTGRLAPGDAIVLVIVACAHRGEAFAACEFIMDYLKTRAPFWKKEETASGGRWVETKDADDAAASRWNA
ncbi:MAG TPA: molybdopterin synthase catalytic subunit MoaE [Rhodocyclaceae bacterium]|nr:molybdopterin synthase catalytic subunit MoaE [Rhodocyclaceae bacterium]